mgnify:FL=1
MESNHLFFFFISLSGLFFLFFNTFLFIRKKEIHKDVSKVFLLYLVSLSLIELACHIIGILKPNSNFFISHFYFIFQFTFLSYLYSKLIRDKLFNKIIAVVYFSQILILGYMYVSNPSLFWKFNEYEIIATSLILVFYALCFIYKEIDKVHYYYNFSIGLILYLLCSISIFLYGNLELVLIEDPYIDIWIFNTIFYIVFQFMIFREYAFFNSKLYKNDNEEDDVLLGD